MLPIYKTVQDLQIAVYNIVREEAAKKCICDFKYATSKKCTKMVDEIFSSNYEFTKEEIASFLQDKKNIDVKEGDIKRFGYSFVSMMVELIPSDKTITWEKVCIYHEDIFDYVKVYRLHKQISSELSSKNVDKKTFKI